MTQRGSVYIARCKSRSISFLSPTSHHHKEGRTKVFKIYPRNMDCLAREKAVGVSFHRHGN